MKKAFTKLEYVYVRIKTKPQISKYIYATKRFDHCGRVSGGPEESQPMDSVSMGWSLTYPAPTHHANKQNKKHIKK